MTILRVVLRNLTRHKLRVTLGFVAVFLASLLFHLYIGATGALDEFFSGSLMRSTMFVKSRTGGMWVASLPSNFAEEIAHMPGVLAATPLVTAGAVMAQGRDPVPIIGFDPQQFRVVAERDIAELAPEVLERFTSDPSAMLVSRGIAMTHGLRVGTRVDMPLVPNVDTKLYPDFRPPPNPRFQASIVGQLNRGVFSDRVVIVHRKVLERALQWERAYAILVRYKPGSDPGELAGRIEELLSNRDGGVEVLILDSWFGGIQTFVKELSTLVLGFIALIGLLAAAILTHGVSVAAYEMLPEIGTLRALGSSRAGVLFLLAGEGLAVCILGATAATLSIWWLTSTTTLIDLKEIDPNIAPMFQVQASSVFLVALTALGIALAGAGVPTLYLTRASIASLLRRSE